MIDGNAVDYKTGDMIYKTDDAYNFVDGRPYSWTLSGDARYFGDLLTPEGLAEVKTYADGIGPWKPQILSWKVSPFPETNDDGSAYSGTLADVTELVPTHLVQDAHRLGLFVHTYTFRNEAKYLAGLYKGDPEAEYIPYFAAGVDGVFTDFVNTGVAARKRYLEEAAISRKEF